MLSVVMLNVIKLSVIMLILDMLSVVKLRVMAPILAGNFFFQCTTRPKRKINFDVILNLFPDELLIKLFPSC